MGGKGSGRKSEIEQLTSASTIIASSAPPAAQYLADVISKRVKKPSWARMRACFFILEQQLGKAAQKHEIVGEGGAPLTIMQLALMMNMTDEQTEKYLAGQTNQLPQTPTALITVPVPKKKTSKTAN